MSISVEFTVNGQRRAADVDERTLLANLLRDDFGLTGTHIGCDTSQCGCCTIHLNGKAVKSCTVLAAQANGADIVTIEGLANGNELHPVQRAFSECHGLQCGFCTPGMIMTVTALLKKIPNPTDEDIYHGIEGNLCRCTGYINIVKAARQAAKEMR
jgi:carbon-monoxide dehydrogenase small subunit